MAAVAGLRGSGDWATDERPKNFREFILWRNPNGMAPIFALMARVQKESTDDPEFSWWDEPNDIVRLTVNGALGTGDTTVIVDSADPSASAPGNVYGVAKHLKAGDMLLVEPSADNATYDHEIIEVVSVVSDTEFTVTRGAQGTTAASISNDGSLLHMGSAYAEGSGAPSSVSRNPIKYFNYTQIFKDTYEISGTAEQTHVRTGDPVKNDKRRKMFAHSKAIEMALLFGQRSETTGSNGKPKRTMNGLRAFMPAATTNVWSSAWTVNDFLDQVAPVFDFDTQAGDERIAFCGNAALNFLNKKIAAASGMTAIQLNVDKEVNSFGVKFVEFVLPQGKLYLKTHPLMNRHALYKNSMFITDMSALKWRPMKGRDTRFKDNVQAKDEDVRRGYWQTEGGLEIAYGGLTCGYLGGFDAT